MFWLCIVISVIIIIIPFVTTIKDTDLPEQNRVTYAAAYAVFMVFLALFSMFAGDCISKTTNYCVVENVKQTKNGYFINTDRYITLFQKECSYKPGDTLWIKK
jgi:hypothetical protein